MIRQSSARIVLQTLFSYWRRHALFLFCATWADHSAMIYFLLGIDCRRKMLDVTRSTRALLSMRRLSELDARLACKVSCVVGPVVALSYYPPVVA
ncbi:uncharacterized protein LAESUDRAFT_371334 [Laetiporus sulphureus 93-53]|uniref:Uncharacterized protein n=1 Tax=Laetiporus sulphureus 93-53 TaxID=1314785 RepID=A0A165CQY6_9APHY|nr:uncharacterized protein LAESUDRAFT_371334 [Laetiporus sulphureus 93-53]KZT03264.1 hypothetical protein LAESUDRAFT_371334 [Laetiporus sulphureus 93-53]